MPSAAPMYISVLFGSNLPVAVALYDPVPVRDQVISPIVFISSWSTVGALVPDCDIVAMYALVPPFSVVSGCGCFISIVVFVYLD